MPSRRKTNPDGSRNEAGSTTGPSGGVIGLLCGVDGLSRICHIIAVAAHPVPHIGDGAAEEERDGEHAGQDDLQQHAAGSRIDIGEEHGSLASASVVRMLTARRRDGHAGRKRAGGDWTSIPFHPFLVAAYPIVFLFAANADEQVTLDPLWMPLALALGATAVVLVALA